MSGGALGRRWLHRLASLCFVLVAASSSGYLLLRAAPGDPVELLSASARDARPERKAELRRQYGLDEPAGLAALRWSGRVLRGELGVSFLDGRSVAAKIGERLPVTLCLALLTVILAAAGGLLLGQRLVGAAPRAQLVSAVVYALPTAALAVIALGLGAPYGKASSLVPAALCLALPLGASLALQLGQTLTATLAEPFVTTLRARGLPDAAVRRRALVASLGPAIALALGLLPALLSGALVVEVLLGVPGLGLLAYEALLSRDHPVVLGLLVVSSVTALLASWLGDGLRRLVDPRLGSDGERPGEGA